MVGILWFKKKDKLKVCILDYNVKKILDKTKTSTNSIGSSKKLGYAYMPSIFFIFFFFFFSVVELIPEPEVVEEEPEPEIEFV